MAAYSDTTKLNLTQFSLHSPLRYINNILSIMLGYLFGKNSWYVFHMIHLFLLSRRSEYIGMRI